MSFKLKLVAYFLLVSLLPLGAAGWALHAVSGGLFVLKGLLVLALAWRLSAR